jgi:phage gp36-like protein
MAYSTLEMVRLALFPFQAGYDGSNPPDPVSNTPADLSNDQINDAIAEADSTIDSYISKYYAVPVMPIISGQNEDGTVGSIPHPIDYWSRNIAAYNCTLSYRQGLDFADTDPIARRYNATMAALTSVRDGKANLQLPGNTTDNAAVGAGQVFNPYVGDLFTPSDFNLLPMPSDWPLGVGLPGGYGEFWRSP